LLRNRVLVVPAAPEPRLDRRAVERHRDLDAHLPRLARRQRRAPRDEARLGDRRLGQPDRHVLVDPGLLLPESQEPLKKIQAAWDTPDQEEVLENYFRKLPKISIDYAVMERAANVYAIRLNCRWLDMGSFAALADVIESDQDNNIVVAGASQLMDCKNSIFVTEDKNHLIAAIGLKNMVVAHSADATLVCPIGETDKLKELLDRMKYSYDMKSNCSKVTIIGNKMRGVPGVMAKTINALSKRRIEILQTSDSHTTISCLIDSSAISEAVNALHQEFELGKPYSQ
jgi:hypothetical protein